MAETTASIIQVVAWGTRLSLSLYDYGISNPSSTREANRIAKAVSLFTLMLKQVGTSLKEDNTIPSVEAFETVQEIVLQANEVFNAIEAVLSEKPKRDSVRFEDEDEETKERGWSNVSRDKVRYLRSYVHSLNSTLAVMLQAFYTVRVIAWSRSRQDRLPAVATDAVANERSQLEVLIVEQQLLLLDVFDAFSRYHRTREDEGLGLQQDPTPPPANLDKYKDESIGDRQSKTTLTESSSLVRRASSRFSNEVLAKWTQLRDIERRLSLTDSEEDKPKPVERRRSYQPTLESTTVAEAVPTITRNSPEFVMSPRPQRPPSAQIGAMERGALPLPIAIPQSGPRTTGPFSPAYSYSVSPASTTYFPASPARPSPATGYFPASPRSSFQGSYPGRPAPVLEEKGESSDGLGIPWRLWLQSSRWDFVDDKVIGSNSQLPPDQAYNDRSAWTEIMQTWVRREALEEARYSFNQIQKDVPDGNRTKREMCFCIGRPLTYSDIRRLVDRSIDIYRQSQAVQPSPRLDSDNRSIGAGSSASTRRHRTSRQRNTSNRTNRDDYPPSSDSSDSESDAKPRSRYSGSSSKSYHGSSSGGGSSSGRRRKESSRGSGGSTFGTLAKVGGIATLLEGLPEILGAL